jgi:ATP-dependent Lon protease
MEAGRRIMLVAQKSAAKDEPKPRTCSIGCVSSILQMLKLPDGTVKVLVEGVQRAASNPSTVQSSTSLPTATPLLPATRPSHEIEACAAP